MKPMVVFTLFAGLVSSAPAVVEVQTLGEREAQGVFDFATRNELEEGTKARCPDAILIFARGSIEIGNMGATAGPILAKALENKLGPKNIWIQGVGAPYNAELLPNFFDKGTNQKSIDEAKRLFRMANDKCPRTPVFAGGYSQGTAVIGNALTELDEKVKNQVVGTVLFGYTKNEQNTGAIAGYPKSRTAVYCGFADAVCHGSLFILPGHFSYGDDASGKAAEFLLDKI